MSGAAIERTAHVHALIHQPPAADRMREIDDGQTGIGLRAANACEPVTIRKVAALGAG